MGCHILKIDDITGKTETTASDGQFDALCMRISLFNALINIEKPEKRALVELKNGKVSFKQKAMTVEKNSETMSGGSRQYCLPCLLSHEAS